MKPKSVYKAGRNRVQEFINNNATDMRGVRDSLDKQRAKTILGAAGGTAAKDMSL